MIMQVSIMALWTASYKAISSIIWSHMTAPLGHIYEVKCGNYWSAGAIENTLKWVTGKTSEVRPPRINERGYSSYSEEYEGI